MMLSMIVSTRVACHTLGSGLLGLYMAPLDRRGVAAFWQACRGVALLGGAVEAIMASERRGPAPFSCTLLHHMLLLQGRRLPRTTPLPPPPAPAIPPPPLFIH